MPSNSLASESAVVARPTFAALLLRAAPGLILCGAMAGIAMLLHELPLFRLFSPMIVAVVAGRALRGFNLVPQGSQAGLSFAARPLLRLAIILLGFQLTWHQIQPSISTIMLTMALAAIGFTVDVRKLRERGLGPFTLGVAPSVFIGAVMTYVVQQSR
jgi:uncharacterized membrane protein YadS